MSARGRRPWRSLWSSGVEAALELEVLVIAAVEVSYVGLVRCSIMVSVRAAMNLQGWRGWKYRPVGASGSGVGGALAGNTANPTNATTTDHRCLLVVNNSSTVHASPRPRVPLLKYKLGKKGSSNAKSARSVEASGSCGIKACLGQAWTSTWK